MTAYRIAQNPGDYAAAHVLLKAEGMDEKLSFPTIIALDSKKLVVGLLGTRIQDKMIVAGPLVLKSDRRRPITAVRIVDFYDLTMRGMGIASYVFHTEEGSIIDQSVERLMPGVKPYAIENGKKFYIRRLN